MYDKEKRKVGDDIVKGRQLREQPFFNGKAGIQLGNQANETRVLVPCTISSFHVHPFTSLRHKQNLQAVGLFVFY
jgi:hypothetical protein